VRKQVRRACRFAVSVGTSLCVATLFAVIMMRRSAKDRRDMRP
jgi:hypothetical protein